MRLLISLFICFAGLSANSQKTEAFYDYQWQETDAAGARFYSVVVKTDSGWHRQDFFVHQSKLQMDGVYEDKECKTENGYFHFYNSNGNLKSKGAYLHGKKQGLWLSYYPDGMMADSVVLENDKPIGMRLSWYDNGFPSDSAVFQPDGSGVEITWFDNGNAASAGRFSAGMKQNGKWQYFYKNGKPSAFEFYEDGNLTNKQYFDEQGNIMADTTNRDATATFPGGLSAWGKYLLKHVYFPEQYRITNSDRAVVVISAIVDEDGNVTDAFVDTPFYPQFDDIALNVIKKVPKWKPAMRHNRTVRYAFRQPVTFSQE